jgi:hypothetical protein
MDRQDIQIGIGLGIVESFKQEENVGLKKIIEQEKK